MFLKSDKKEKINFKKVMTKSDDKKWWHTLISQSDDTKRLHNEITKLIKNVNETKGWQNMSIKWWNKEMTQIDDTKW